MVEIPEKIRDRVGWAIAFAWNVTVDKIACGEITVNKEASLQLHYSSVLKTVLELVKFAPDERVEIELESTILIGGRSFHIDVLLNYKSRAGNGSHAIELKCYKKFASSGRRRGAGDIFMFEVYKDLHATEQYVLHQKVDEATCLILTDYNHFINPKRSDTKNWDYRISNGHTIVPGRFTTMVGSKEKPVDFNLLNAYTFHWRGKGKFWSVLLRPHEMEND